LRRVGRKRTALPGLPWSTEFMDAYQAALENTPKVEIGASRAKPGTLNAAIVAYYKSTAFTNGLSPVTQKHRRQVLDRFRGEHGDGNTVPRGERQLRTLTRQQLSTIVAKHVPHSQRHLLNALRGLMLFAVDTRLIDEDPSLGIKRAKPAKTGGYYTWTEEDVAKFEAKYAIGTRARLAFSLMLYLAVRRSDVVRIGPQHVRGGVFTIKPQKTSRTTGIEIHVPVLPELAHVIAATPSGHLTFLATQKGKTRSASGFGNKMREWCDEAGLPECSSHGLRKACCRRLAEAGCSVHQIAAITGHKDLREIQLYCEAADKKRLARQAIGRLMQGAEAENENADWQTSPRGLPTRGKI
jgi:integrase